MVGLVALVALGSMASVGAMRCSRPVAGARQTSMSLGSNLAAVPLMYGLMSVNEYVTHRYYQHTDVNRIPLFKSLNVRVRGGGHPEHHAETLDDMSLKSDARWMASPAAKVLDVDKYRGTAFNWLAIAGMFLQMCVSCIPVMKLLLGFSALTTIKWIVPSLLLHTTMWNALHPHMHGLPDVGLLDGPPTGLLARFRSTRLFRFLYANHQGHHVVGGTGNFNVCCPGIDHLLGTFHKESSWRPKMRTAASELKLVAAAREEEDALIS